MLNFDERCRSGKELHFDRKLRLPLSLVEFYNVYSLLGGKFKSIKNTDLLGFLYPNEIQPLIEYDRALVDILMENPTESDDIEYYKYGRAQDNIHSRTSYLSNALVVGQYGFSSNELILLYPDSCTLDGEFETAMLALASQCRTISFAEMMRQLSYFFLQEPDSLPIYTSEQLINTCADLIELEGQFNF